MKTIAKSLLLGLLIIGAFLGVLFLTAQAANARPVGSDKAAITAVRHAAYITKNGQIVNVLIEKPAGRRLEVTIFNGTRDVLAYHQLPKGGAGVFRLKFNVANLTDGDYSVRILGKAVAADYTIKLETPRTEAVRNISLR